ncbi:MAG: PorP/SprF family type IX secretion system membrane protein [Fluviicola sp.]|nr:PorP/SprF family type IX secretion system membrane protein [Fluviicola sp.]
MNLVKSISVIILVLLGFNTTAQDVHFSQVEYSPMTLNPALTGANSPLQVIVNYRSQWRSVASPYNTIAASIDARLNDKKRMKKGIFAVGMNLYQDQAGDNRVKTSNVNLNLAYHLILDRRNTLGLGIYGGFGQRSISAGSGTWGSQYSGLAYDPSLPSNEIFNNASFSFLDAGAGLVYTYNEGSGYMTQNSNRSFNAGVAFFHVNNPSYSFIENENEKLYMRWSLFVNGKIGLANSNGTLLPGIYFNRQKTSTEFLYGMYYRFTINEGSKITGRIKPFFISIGLFHRWSDALVAKTMLEWSEFSAGFAYDINISSLTPVSNARGGFEVFLRYNMQNGVKGSRAKIR